MKNVTEERRTLGALLRLPYEALARRIYGELSESGFPDVRAAHSGVFRHIRPDGSRLTELADRAQMTKQSMAYLVESLKQNGCVEVVPDPTDGRARLVRLTPRGHSVLRTLVDISERAEEDLARRMGTEKAAQLRSLLEEAAEALSESHA